MLAKNKNLLARSDVESLFAFTPFSVLHSKSSVNYYNIQTRT